MTAGMSNCFISENSNSGIVKAGNEFGISPNLAKTVGVLKPEIDTRIVVIKIAPSMPGTRLRHALGQYAIISMETTPTSSVRQSVVWIFSQITTSFGMKSSGTDSIFSPRKSFICVDIIKTAIPFVKPTTTGRGM